MSLEEDTTSSAPKMMNIRSLSEVARASVSAILSPTTKTPGIQDQIGSDTEKLERQMKIEQIDAVEKDEIAAEDTPKSAGSTVQPKTQQLKVISLDEIAWHDTADNCWFAIYDYVYDCTEFLRDHPGGEDILLEYAGRDATLAFIGAGHSKFAQKTLERYLIGELPMDERIFRISGGVQVYG